MKLAFFKPKKQTTTHHKTWLSEKELAKLQTLAEQLQSTSITNITLNSQQSGLLASRALGSGTDYAESRVYQYGDDPRSINWRLSARSTDTFVKTFHTESRPCVSILLDQRKGMIFGTKKRLKISQALRVASLLAYSCDLHQLSFQAWVLRDDSLLSFNNTEAFLSTANQQIEQTESTLHKSLDSAMQEVLPQLSINSLFYLISDFSSINKNTHLSAISERCNTHGIHIQDPAEVSLSNTGEIYFQGEQREQFKIKTQNKTERLDFSQVAQAVLQKRKALLTNLGINYCAILTNEDNIQTKISLPLKSI